MSELVTRALTGAAYVILALGAAWAGPMTTSLLFLPVCAIGANELHRLYWSQGEGPLALWDVMLASAAYLALALSALVPEWTFAHAIASVFLLIMVGVTMSLRRGPVAPAAEFGGLLLQILYIALPFALLPHLLQNGPHLLAGIYFLLWTNDTGAYLVGRAIGRNQLLPAVSPKKTIEGLAGGVVLTLGVAWFLSRFWVELAPFDWLMLAVIVSATGTLGDLLESAFKRAHGVKDSGTVLPGHGGILDRFDGFLLAVPGAFAYLYLIR